MERILEMARKVAEQAEVIAIEREETPVSFEANKLKLLEARSSYGVALRIVKDGKVGFSGTSKLDNPQAVVDAAVAASKFGPEARFVLPGLQTYPEVETFDSAILELSVEKMVELGNEIIARIRDRSSDITCEGGLHKGISRVAIKNSQGGHAEYRSSAFGVGVEGVVVNGTDMLFVWDSESSSRPILDVSQIVGRITKRLDRAAKIVAAPKGNLPVIFTPSGFASAFISSLAMAFNGKVVLQGASPLGGKLGQQLFDPKLSIVDDPTIAYRPASRPCDDEGVSSQQNILIEKGVPKGFLYDLQTAALAGTRSTGSASRSLESLPSPANSSIMIMPGEWSVEKMLSDVSEGIFVEMLMGATQGNVLGGEFSGNVLLGYKIENGEIVGRVKDTMVSGNVYSALREIAGIGSEVEWVGASLNSPAFYFKNLAVATNG